MRKILIILLLAIINIHLISNANSEEMRDAIFGLKWGMTIDEVKSVGVTLESEMMGEYGQRYSASNLPKILSDVEDVFLSFGYNNNLWRIYARSKTFQDDPYGISVKSRFEELSEILNKKYGKGDNTAYIEKGYYSQPQEFLNGIESGHNWCFTNYNTETLFLQLAINALSDSDGVYVIIAQDKNLAKSYKEGKSKSETEAL